MASKDFSTIEELSISLKSLFKVETKNILLYAFNATGKTRLASTFLDEAEVDIIESIVYSAHFEDMFSWDNEANTLHVGAGYQWILETIRDEGLDKRIVDNFQRHTNSRIEPALDFTEKVFSFRVASGDDDRVENIKISRGEESLLIWSIFYTLLEHVAENLDEEEVDRATDIFNSLKYIVIDDPVSSMDDTRIVSMAIDLVEISKKLMSKNINILITTHHALFYNVIANSNIKNSKKYSLHKTTEGLSLNTQDDSPFGYHLFAKDLIQKAVDGGSIERYHFNLFRALLEKTANFLGYAKFESCLRDEKRTQFKRSLHLNSHGKLSEMESRELSNEDKSLFIMAFQEFVQDFEWPDR